MGKMTTDCHNSVCFMQSKVYFDRQKSPIIFHVSRFMGNKMKNILLCNGVVGSIFPTPYTPRRMYPMPRNGNIAVAVRDNIATYMAARPSLRLREIAKICDLSYSGLSKLMAAKSTVTALSTDTIDKLSAGLNIPAAWLVLSSGTEMANMSFTGAKIIDAFLIKWAKNLFLGDVGYETMRDYYADSYYVTTSNPIGMREAGVEVREVRSLRKDGFEIFGIGAEDEFRMNAGFSVHRFVINTAKIIGSKRLVVTCETLSLDGHNRRTDSGSTCLGFESPFQSMIKNVPAAPIRLTSNSIVGFGAGHSTIARSQTRDLIKDSKATDFT